MTKKDHGRLPPRRIGAAKDGLMDGIPETAHVYARALASRLTPNLLNVARKAIERIRDSSETADLITEADPAKAAIWRQHLDHLLERLSPHRS
jgi:hypothetical protein